MNLKIEPFTRKHDESGGELFFPGLFLKNPRILYITGDNGSGKSTFLKTLRNKKLFSINSTYERPAFLDQKYESYIFPYKPIWWNIYLPNIIKNKVSRNVAIDEAKKLVSKLNVTIDVTQNPSFASNQSAYLSGGETHIILLLRTLLMGRKIVFLDEPFTGLDIKNRGFFKEKIQEMANRGIIFFIVTHITMIKSHNEEDKLEFQGFHRKKIAIHFNF